MDLCQMLNNSYARGKLSVVNRQITSLENQIRTLKREKMALLRTLNDKYDLRKVETKRKSVVEITVDESSEEEYQDVRLVSPNKTIKEYQSVLTLEPNIIPLLN